MEGGLASSVTHTEVGGGFLTPSLSDWRREKTGFYKKNKGELRYNSNLVQKFEFLFTEIFGVQYINPLTFRYFHVNP